MRRFFDDVVGNTALKQSLGEDIATGRLSHAYILEGENGSGRHTVALRIAAALACEHRKDENAPLPCMQCPACRKILSGNSPDVIYINRGDKATLGVEAIRGLKSDVYIAPNDNDSKVYIIEDAQLLTVQAQNALLLTLEEPPPYVLFLLLCRGSENLLETIRSRAPIRRLEPIASEEIDNYLRESIPEARRMTQQELGEIIAAADGSIGRAVKLLDPKLYKPIVERRSTAREFVRLCAGGRNSVAGMKMIGTLSAKKREEITEQCNEILLCLRDLLLCKQTEEAPLCFFFDREEACTLSYGFTTPTLLQLTDAVLETVEKLRQNANVRLALTSLGVTAGLLQ